MVYGGVLITNNKTIKKGQKVYVSSDDARQGGYYATVVSVGSKYITTENSYGQKSKFNKETLYNEDWSIYRLEVGKEEYEKRLLKEEKVRKISRNVHRLSEILTEEEIDDIYNRIINKYGNNI